MKTFLKLILLFFSGLVFPNCNTLYNSRIIDLEITVPATVVFPKKFEKIAVRYNNFNTTYNPHFANYYQYNKIFTDSTNTDSIAAEIYFMTFLETIKNSLFFDSIIEIEPGNYSNTRLSGSILDMVLNQTKDRLNPTRNSEITVPVTNFLTLAGKYQPDKKNSFVKNPDPEFALYTKDDLIQIADSTGAGLLLSLDYFATLDRDLTLSYQEHTGYFDVFVIAYWNFYDLENFHLSYFYDRVDTLTWDFITKIVTVPNRRNGIKEAAEISGGQFARFLVPHWIEVQRMYYRSGQIDLKKADKLISERKWLEAAEIWRKHVKNPNQKIAAKSMFNMALVCEMLNQMDAAVDWAVQSYHVFGQKNPIHKNNCLEYINILAQRKLDIRKLDFQFNPESFSQKQIPEDL
jgi:hypothetical protein